MIESCRFINGCYYSTRGRVSLGTPTPYGAGVGIALFHSIIFYVLLVQSTKSFNVDV